MAIITKDLGKVTPDIDTTLTQSGQAADAKATGDEIADLKEDLNEYESIFTGDVDESVKNWLDEHPEATTTVQDGSITANKFNESVDITNNEINSIIDALGYYEEITYSKEHILDTDCYIVTVPKLDSNNNIINPYIGFSSTRTPNEYARDNGTSLTFNGACNLKKTDDTWQVPNIVSRGTVIYNSNITGTLRCNDARYINIKANRTYADYPISTTLATLQANGAYNVFNCYCKLVENSQALDLTNVTLNEDGRLTESRGNSAFGIKSDLSIILFYCDEKTFYNRGFTGAEVAAEMVNLGCVDAWMLDGGGSASINIKGSKLNRNVDSNGTADRMIRFTFNIKKGE